ncbi:MAG: methyltransferase domain-containing protein [Patescibacteria group bacterium]|jgi:cyclopropane fatty-acyl-phospholipid synthase-like methyltransferase
MNTDQQKVVAYFSRPESRWGYDLILRGSKHFGYYPSGQADITESEAQVLMQELVAKNLDLKPGQAVLDAGCGQGVVSTYLAEKYHVNVIGITIVPFEITKSVQRAHKLGVGGNVEYQIMDYSATAFPDGHFDAIYTTETLSHSPDVAKTLREFYRILKPGGRIAFFEYAIAHDEQFTAWEKKNFDIVMEGSAMMGLKQFHYGQFTHLLRVAGIENAREESITNNVRPSFYRLHKLAVWPYRIVRLFRWQKHFVNITAGFEYYRMVEKGLLRYSIYTGNKPS